MFGDEDEESVFSRLGTMIADRFGFIAPLWIANRPESLTIVDYRPTFTMFITVVGFVALLIGFVLILFRVDAGVSFALWALGLPAAACVIFLFRGTIRETYYFDRAKDSYAFVRQFIHRKELIEGAMSQFTGAYVKTEENDDSTSYFVMLKQDGMFMTGATEQALRESVPVFNSFDREARIANAISSFLHSKPQ